MHGAAGFDDRVSPRSPRDWYDLQMLGGAYFPERSPGNVQSFDGILPHAYGK